MKASIVDLRYKMKDILKALDRNERVTILYHGKVKGVITPVSGGPGPKIRNHPFFGMRSGEPGSVEDEMAGLRGGRFNAV